MADLNYWLPMLRREGLQSSRKSPLLTRFLLNRLFVNKTRNE